MSEDEVFDTLVPLYALDNQIETACLLAKKSKNSEKYFEVIASIVKQKGQGITKRFPSY